MLGLGQDWDRVFFSKVVIFTKDCVFQQKYFGVQVDPSIKFSV